MTPTLPSPRRLPVEIGRNVLDHALVILALLMIAGVTFGVHPASENGATAPFTTDLSVR